MDSITRRFSKYDNDPVVREIRGSGDNDYGWSINVYDESFGYLILMVEDMDNEFEGRMGALEFGEYVLDWLDDNWGRDIEDVKLMDWSQDPGMSLACSITMRLS